MAANVYIKVENVDHRLLTNDTGADMSQYDFGVVGPFAAVADEDVTSGSTGGYHIEEGITVQTDELKTAENTFGTLYQSVYWDSVNLKFSDTETAGYYLVGYLTKVKDSAGVIEFEKLRYAELVAS
jgi:hypothetical protein